MAEGRVEDREWALIRVGRGRRYLASTVARCQAWSGGWTWALRYLPKASTMSAGDSVTALVERVVICLVMRRFRP